MSGHTSGPWKFRVWMSDDNPERLRSLGLEPVPALTNDGSRFIMGPKDAEGNGRRVALVDCRTPFKRGTGHKTECAERDANARLIAEAPNLLAALDRMIRSCRVPMGRCEPSDAAIKQAESAIAAATGGKS